MTTRLPLKNGREDKEREDSPSHDDDEISSAGDVTKFLLPLNTNDRAVEAQCASLIGNGDGPIAWARPSRGTRTRPPDGTIAIVIKLEENKGAIRIYNSSDAMFFTGVGTEEASSLVMMAWDNAWYYSTSGFIEDITLPWLWNIIRGTREM